MNGVVIGALVALSMVQQTDTVVPAQGARVLDLELAGGTATVTAWDRDEIAVRADHSMRTHVEIRRSRNGSTVSVESEADRGPATIVDYEITVPRAMRVEVDGHYVDVTVEGVAGGVEVDVTQGDLVVRGVSGSMSLSSTTGKIRVEDSEGDVEAETAAGEIRLVGVRGKVSVESAGGDIILDGVESSSVDAGTVGGRVFFRGAYRPGGTYLLGTHGGSMTLVVPDPVSATFRLATIYGSVLDTRGTDVKRYESGKRHTLEMGAGEALVEAETFGGRILLVGEGSEAAVPPGRDRK